VKEDAHALEAMIRIASSAAALVREAYAGEVLAEYKGPDDPVTRVDRAANELIVQALDRAFPGVPIVAEESDPRTFAGRTQASEVFFVDPLDGTREFLAKNGEFAVMIGLARNGAAVLGVIDCPAVGRVFGGGGAVPSFEIAPDGSRRALVARTPGDRLRVLVSRSRFGEKTRAALAKLGEVEIIPTGSAGLKTALVCAGDADAYVHLEQAGMLWDSCPGDAIAKGSGVTVSSGDGALIDYREGDLQLSRGVVVAATGVHSSLVSRLSR
jgi:3'(2'), 5'-bisphosphate nucleotidase